jgi:hypothetical protein
MDSIPGLLKESGGTIPGDVIESSDVVRNERLELVGLRESWLNAVSGRA